MTWFKNGDEPASAIDKSFLVFLGFILLMLICIAVLSFSNDADREKRLKEIPEGTVEWCSMKYPGLQQYNYCVTEIQQKKIAQLETKIKELENHE